MSTPEKIFLGGLVIFAALVWILPLAAGVCMERQERKKRDEADDSKARFDERQRLIRLEAGVHTLYALGGYLLLWLVLEAVGVLRWDGRTPILLTGGLMLAVLVWSGECILRGAMLGFNQRKNESTQIIMYLAMGACWVLLGGSELESRNDAGMVAVRLFLGISYLILGGLMLYARHKRKAAEGRLDAEDGAE